MIQRGFLGYKLLNRVAASAIDLACCHMHDVICGNLRESAFTIPGFSTLLLINGL